MAAETATYDPRDRAPRAVVTSALALNALLFAGAGTVWYFTRSQLVLAQGGDSLMDVGVGVILVVSAWVGNQPRDENHPFGHHRAEPIGALVAAVLAGVLAVEVLQSSVGALIAGETAEMTGWIALLLGAKLATKLGLLFVVLGLRRRRRSSALDALRVDTRNDVVAASSSLLGFALARAGFAWADAGLAIPVAFYIAASGFELARDNLRYLMGEAPDDEVIAELLARAAATPGVLEVGRLRAQYVGPVLHVEVRIVIGERKSATQGHDIAVDVQRRLEEHELVGETFVHVDTAEGRDH